MIIKRLKDCPEFIAGDGSILRELLHAAKGTFDFRYSLAHATVKPNKTTLPHKLRTSEVYYITHGKGIMHIGQETETVEPGDAVYIPPHTVQYIENKEKTDLVFLCVVDPAWRKEDEEVV